MFKALTPDSDPREIAAMAELLPKLASLLNSDDQAKRLLQDHGQGDISEQELILGLKARLEATEVNSK